MQGVVHGRSHPGIAPVQIRLLGQKRVQIILPARLVVAPSRARKHRKPVVRRPAVGLRVAPDVPIVLGIVAGGPALDEPGVLIRRMVGHEIQDHPEPERFRLGQQPVEICERAEQRADVGVIRHVVSVIRHRRGIDRAQPDRIGAQPGNMVEPPVDAGEIPDPAPGRVLIGARIDVVDDPALPPRRSPDHDVLPG